MARRGSGSTAAAHPGLDSQGDLTGDNHPGLWAPSGSASLVVITGRADDGMGTVFAAG
ncbi:hypothetical protein [Streptomyces sp. NPDC006552]|uniref:hypothetical protein n=1 Tax=Streptomyces sp. NPDC006552 TaxID=3157179 RepID=UPI0033B285D4